jgi:hypothetical protein
MHIVESKRFELGSRDRGQVPKVLVRVLPLCLLIGMGHGGWTQRRRHPADELDALCSEMVAHCGRLPHG